MIKSRKWHRTLGELRLRCLPEVTAVSYGPSWPKAWPCLPVVARLELLAHHKKASAEQIGLWLYPPLSQVYAQEFEGELAKFWYEAIKERSQIQLRHLYQDLCAWRGRHRSLKPSLALGASLFKETLCVEISPDNYALRQNIYALHLTCLDADTEDFRRRVANEIAHIRAPKLVKT
jgi:hypothetical protein